MAAVRDLSTSNAAFKSVINNPGKQQARQLDGGLSSSRGDNKRPS